MDFIDYIKYEDLPKEQQEFADIIGFEPYIKLVKNYGGGSIYIPGVKTIENIYKKRQIKAEFNGFNYKELAQKYHLSTTWIREILSS